MELAIVDQDNGSALSIPQVQKEHLKNAAALAADVAKIVRDNGLSKNFGGAKDHVFVEGWLTISRVNNEAPHAKIEAVETHGEFEVIKARAWITDAHGNVVSEADGYCSVEEKNWKGKPFYARASMAQTRAIGKAMRLRHAWVMVMAGFSPTPAEEMDGIHDEPKPAPAKKEYQLKPKTASREGDEAKPVPTVVVDTEAAGELVTVLKVATKTGEKNGKPWTRFGIQAKFASGETEWLNTFDTKFGALAQENVNGQLRASFDVAEYQGKAQYNLTGLEVANG